jgi:hypothetical protein
VTVWWPRRAALSAFPRSPLGAQAQHILTSQACDGAFQNRGAGGSLADLLRDFRSQPRIFRLPHQRQRLLDLLVRDQVEELRLLQLHGQSLAQRAVKNGVARRVAEIGKHNRVLVGELCFAVKCPLGIKVTRNDEREGGRGGGNNHLPAFWDASCGYYPARIRVPSEALEVGANVGSMLVAQVAIFFEAFVDDTL